MAARTSSRESPFPDLAIDDFLYGHEGPWPQPSRDHPFGLAPGIYQIPKAEWDDWTRYVGNYYLEKAAPFGVKSAEIAVHDALETALGIRGNHRRGIQPPRVRRPVQQVPVRSRSARQGNIQGPDHRHRTLRLPEVRLHLHARGEANPSGRGRGGVRRADPPAEERQRIQLRGRGHPAAALGQGREEVRRSRRCSPTPTARRGASRATSCCRERSSAST